MKFRQKTILGCVFFLTGAAGLMYQVAWQRKLIDLFGISIYSATAIVSSFMAGLGIGSQFGGWWSTRVRNPLIAFGAIECLTAAFGAVSIPVLSWMGQQSYFELLRGMTDAQALSAYFVLAFVFCLVPTILMGMSLPLLAQGLIRNNRDLQPSLGNLYGVNAVGASLGALLSGFVLIEICGIRGTTFVAAALNGVAGLTTILVFRRVASILPAVDSKVTTTTSVPWSPLVAAFLVGFASLGYEIFSFRYLTVLLGDIPYAFALLLYFYLGFIGIGSLFTQKILNLDERDESDIVPLIGHLLASVILWIVFIFFVLWAFDLNVFRLHEALILGHGRYLYHPDELASAPALFLACFLLLSPGLLFGALFPAYVALVKRKGLNYGGSVALVYSANSAGSVLGCLAFGLVLIPRAGSHISLLVITIVPFLLITLQPGIRRRRAWRGPALAFVSALLLFYVCHQTLYPTTTLASGLSRVVDTREGALGVFSVEESQRFPHVRSLYVNNMPTASCIARDDGVYAGHSSQTLAFSFMMTSLTDNLHGRAFFLGFGEGHSVSTALANPTFEGVDAVELNQEVYDLVFKANPALKTLVTASPRARLFTQDAKRFLQNHDDQYSLIHVLGFSSSHSGSGYIFSREFAQLMSRHLGDRGTAVIAAPDLYFMEGLLETFRYVALVDYFAVCSNQPLRFSRSLMHERWSQMPPDFRRAVPWPSVDNCLRTHPVRDYRAIAALLPHGVPAATIDRPRSEFKLLRSMRPSVDTIEKAVATYGDAPAVGWTE